VGCVAAAVPNFPMWAKQCVASKAGTDPSEPDWNARVSSLAFVSELSLIIPGGMFRRKPTTI
jgi:hypothetical protein